MKPKKMFADDVGETEKIEAYFGLLSAVANDHGELSRLGPGFMESFRELEVEMNKLLEERWSELQKEYGDELDEFLDKVKRNTALADATRDILLNDVIRPMFTATAKRADSIEYPLDKVNSQIWNLLEEDTSGQLTLKAEKFGSDKPLNIYYAIDFDALEGDITISRRLTAYDKRAYIAVSALYNAGSSVITMTQIYYAMGYTGKPGSKDLERINGAVTKMMGARIYVNNEQEASSYKYLRFVYDGSLLPAERATAVVNGKFTDAVIHVFREPPVITFAKQRKQITTIDVKLLQSPMNKTDQNLLLDDYLIERIARAKNRCKRQKILFRTLYERVGASTAKQKQRIPEKVEKYLEHYKQCGMIMGYELGADGVTVSFV